MFKKTVTTIDPMNGNVANKVTVYYFLGFIPVYKSITVFNRV